MNVRAQRAEPLLEVRGVSKRHALPRTWLWRATDHVQALTDVSFTLQAGRTLGIVGESGSGKSTLARLVMALDQPTQGQVLFNGADLHQLSPQALRQMRGDFQMVFQDPYGSLLSLIHI